MNEEKKKVGRPKGSGEQFNWGNINLKVHEELKEKLEIDSNWCGMSLSEYSRRVIGYVLMNISRKDIARFDGRYLTAVFNNYHIKLNRSDYHKYQKIKSSRQLEIDKKVKKLIKSELAK